MEEIVNPLKTRVLFLSDLFASTKKGSQVMPGFNLGIKSLFRVFPIGSIIIFADSSRQILSSFAHESSWCLFIIWPLIFYRALFLGFVALEARHALRKECPEDERENEII